MTKLGRAQERWTANGPSPLLVRLSDGLSYAPASYRIPAIESLAARQPDSSASPCSENILETFGLRVCTHNDDLLNAASPLLPIARDEGGLLARSCHHPKRRSHTSAPR
jgi:hypothetical protein